MLRIMFLIPKNWVLRHKRKYSAVALCHRLRHKVFMSQSPVSFETLSTALQGAQHLSHTSDFDLNSDAWPNGVDLRPAAVLLPLIERATGLHVVLTKRAANLRNHPGQIAFPGGKVDATDINPQAAALRESQEEIGLSILDTTVLGGLPNHETVTGFDVHLFVAKVNPSFIAIADANEVEEVFEVPLAHVLTPENYLIEGRIWQGKMRRYYVVPFGPYYIWGATARMLRGLAERMGQV